MKKMLCGFLACLAVSAFAAIPASEIVTSSADESGYRIDVPYAYPVTPDMPEWKSLTSLQAMLDACQIPEGTLAGLTTPALIETVLDYPLAVNLYAYGHVSDGVGIVAGQFNGLAELLRRRTGNPGDFEAALSAIASEAAVSETDAFQSMYTRDLLAYLAGDPALPCAGKDDGA